MSVSVITPTIEARIDLLMECVESVQAQTLSPRIHLILLDAAGAGPAVMRNFLLHRAETDLVAFLDDDDLIDVDHIETLAHAQRHTEADLVFSWHRTVGERAPLVPRFDSWSAEAEAYMHAGMNVIPITVLARREAILAAGGFNPRDRWEDYSLWMRMLARGARFTLVPRETWTYRFLGGNRTWA